MAILNEKKDAINGLLSKIEIDGKVYEIKDVLAREAIDALSYISYTNIFANDAAIKDYVDSQVGSINKFDVVIGTAGENGEPNVPASADTMYKLYLIQNADSAAGHYVEYITIRSGVEGAYTYNWEAIGSTKMSLTGYVTETALSEALKPYELKSNLKALAYKDNATGTVAGEIIKGVKATGTTAGSIAVALTEGSETIASTGSYTPAGSVTGGKVKATGTVNVTITNADAQASLATADYQPAGNVTVELAKTDVQVVTSAGTAASFTEGVFTPATLEREEVTANYATEGIVGTVADETLTFTAAGVAALTATKVNNFTGGSKAADKFTANVPASVETKTVATGVNAAAFEGTVATGLKVTGVTYQKHDVATATFAGDEVDVTGATFAGEAATIEVSGNGKTYAVDTANTKFTGAEVELAVGDIAVAAKDVTVQ